MTAPTGSILVAASTSRSPMERGSNPAARASMAAVTGCGSAPSNSASTACAAICKASRSPNAPTSRGPSRSDVRSLVARDRGVILRGFATVAHAVVADDAYRPVADIHAAPRIRLPQFAGGPIAPGNKQQQFAGVDDAGESLVRSDSTGLHRRRTEIGCERVAVRRAVVGRSKFADRDQLGGAGFGLVEALLRQTKIFGIMGVRNNFADAEMVILEDSQPPLFLSSMMD